MDSYRQRYQSRLRGRDSFESKMDKFIQTGRQLVDGVAGNRPGKRKFDTVGKRSSSNLKNVGRWVEEKLDWFFEEEDDWLEPWESDLNYNSKPLSKKRPLQAISLRGPKSIASANKEEQTKDNANQMWPDDSSFRVERWQRQGSSNNFSKPQMDLDASEPKPFSKRPLPRSNRRRN